MPRGSTLELYVIDGVCAGTVFFLPDVPTVLGRSPESHVQVADPWVSSMHALFERRGVELWVVDLESRNGTFVDEARVHEARVHPGSRMRFGKTNVELRTILEAPEPAGPPASTHRTIIRYIADLAARSAPGFAQREQPAPQPPAPAAEPPHPQAPTGAMVAPHRHVGVINEIGRALLGAADVEDSLQRLLRVLSSAVAAETSSVLLLDEQGNPVPLFSDPPDRPPRVSATLVQATLRNRAAILTLDAQKDARFATSESIITHGIRSCITAPIWAEDRILGVLILDRGVIHPFTADDLEIATLVGFQAALAMERARLAERELQLAEGRHRLARQVGAAAAARLLENGAAGLLEPAMADVAVLVASVDGLAALAAARSAAEVAARALAVQRALVDAARAEGGAVDPQLDCGVLAVFDIPPGRPEAPSRARRCAQAMLGRIATLEGWHPAPRLTLRVGLSRGRAFVGNFGGSGSPELRAGGAPVEAALRAAGKARPGEALEGEGTDS